MPIGFIEQVNHTFGYYEATYGILNEHQVGIGESTCSALFGAAARGHGGGALFSVDSLSRLAMERATTAREAVALMGSMAEEHGFYGANAFEGTGESLMVTLTLTLTLTLTPTPTPSRASSISSIASARQVAPVQSAARANHSVVGVGVCAPFASGKPLGWAAAQACTLTMHVHTTPGALPAQHPLACIGTSELVHRRICAAYALPAHIHGTNTCACTHAHASASTSAPASESVCASAAASARMHMRRSET